MIWLDLVQSDQAPSTPKQGWCVTGTCRVVAEDLAQCLAIVSTCAVWLEWTWSDLVCYYLQFNSEVLIYPLGGEGTSGTCKSPGPIA